MSKILRILCIFRLATLATPQIDLRCVDNGMDVRSGRTALGSSSEKSVWAGWKFLVQLSGKTVSRMKVVIGWVSGGMKRRITAGAIINAVLSSRINTGIV
jgi:hypothetical protein